MCHLWADISSIRFIGFPLVDSAVTEHSCSSLQVLPLANVWLPLYSWTTMMEYMPSIQCTMMTPKKMYWHGWWIIVLVLFLGKQLIVLILGYNVGEVPYDVIRRLQAIVERFSESYASWYRSTTRSLSLCHGWCINLIRDYNLTAVA